MSKKDSWSCRTVQQFLQFCNWEGELTEVRPYWEEEESSLESSWQCQSVEKFFSAFNWEGQPQELQQEQNQLQLQNVSKLPKAAIAPPQITLKRLSVKEFFGNCNWYGRSLEANRIWEQLDPYARLKQPVMEFFQFVPWEGEPEIGKLPKSATTFLLPVGTNEPTFSDLSDLF